MVKGNCQKKEKLTKYLYDEGGPPLRMIAIITKISWTKSLHSSSMLVPHPQSIALDFCFVALEH